LKISCYTSGEFDEHLRKSLSDPSYNRVYVLSTYLSRDLAKLLAHGAKDRKIWVIVKIVSYTRRSMRDAIKQAIKYLRKEAKGKVKVKRNEDLTLNMLVLLKGQRATKKEQGELLVTSHPTPAPRSEKAVRKCGFVMLSSSDPREVTEARMVFDRLWAESLALKI